MPAASLRACGNKARKAAPSKAPIAKLTKCGSSLLRQLSGKTRKMDAASTLSTPPSKQNIRIQ